jgi:hypothetical protein
MNFVFSEHSSHSLERKEYLRIEWKLIIRLRIHWILESKGFDLQVFHHIFIDNYLWNIFVNEEKEVYLKENIVNRERDSMLGNYDLGFNLIRDKSHHEIWFYSVRIQLRLTSFQWINQWIDLFFGLNILFSWGVNKETIDLRSAKTLMLKTSKGL